VIGVGLWDEAGAHNSIEAEEMCLCSQLLGLIYCKMDRSGFRVGDDYYSESVDHPPAV
jgi:hypothetical protein